MFVLSLVVVSARAGARAINGAINGTSVSTGAVSCLLDANYDAEGGTARVAPRVRGLEG